MTLNKQLAVILLALLMVGCTSMSPRISKTGLSKASSLPENCEVTVFTTVPKVPFVEVGILDVNVTSWGVDRVEYLYYADKFRDHFQKEICLAGANAVFLWEAAFGSVYLKATLARLETE